MSLNNSEKNLRILQEIFPSLNILEVQNTLQSLLDDKSFSSLIENERKIEKNNAKISKSKHLMVNSDDEEKELFEALQLYKKNKSKPSNVTQNENVSINMSGKNGKQNKKVSQVNNYNKKLETNDIQKNVETNIFTKYEKQGAIPKKLSNAAVCKETKHEKKKKLKNVKKITFNHSLLPEDPERNNQMKDKSLNSGFFYIIPEDPAPGFFLPKGLYYVIPKHQVTPNAKIVSHPRQNLSHKHLDTSLSLNLSDKTTLNNLDSQSVSNHFKSSKSNISPPINIIDNFSLSSFPGRLQELQAFKAEIEGKIDELNSVLVNVLRSLNTAEFDANLQTDSKKFKDKQRKWSIINIDSEANNKSNAILSHFALIELLFPSTDKEYLREKVEECKGNDDLLENFVDSECKRLITESDSKLKFNEVFNLLLSELPDQCPKYLFKKWSRSVGDKENILKFIKEEKSQKELQRMYRFLLEEFSDISDELAWRSAQQYMDSQKSFEEFIEAEHLKRKVQTQLERMIEALPETDLPELVEKAEQFLGNEDLVEEYIKDSLHKELVANRLLNLSQIVPDADPEFLKQKAEEFEGSENDFNVFIYDLLDTQNYPKVCMDKKALEKNRLWNTYVNNFSVKEFLIRVPDPAKYLERDGDNNPAEIDLVLNFLKSRYEMLSVSDLEKGFIDSNRNLTKTCVHFDKVVDFIPLAFSGFQTNDFNEKFLQEITYINNQKEIDAYILELKTRQTIEEELARLDNAFLMCPLCGNEELIPLNSVTCPDGHVFCSECILRYVNVKLGDGVYNYACPFDNCDTFFTYDTLKKLLPENQFTKIIKKQQALEVIKADIDGLESCLFCEFSYIPDPLDKIFKCQNSECLMEICRQCKEVNHIPLRCEEVERPKDLEARKIVEEAMTNKLIRICPTCGKKFVKQDGCNKMTCSCGTMICYICRQKINNYSHFKDSALASSDASCPLYTPNDELHNIEIVEEGVRRREFLLQEDPSLRINMDIK